MVHGDGEGGISDPRLGVDIGGYAGDVVHNTAHGILQAVQQDRLPRRRLVPKQPAGQRAAQHRTGHAGEELGLGEGPPLHEIEAVDTPEAVVAAFQPHLGRLVSTGQSHESVTIRERHHEGVGGHRHVLRDAEITDHLLDEARAASRLVIALRAIQLVCHVRKVAHPVPMHFGGDIRRTYMVGHRQRHYHRDGQPRAYDVDRAEEALLPDQGPCLLYVDLVHTHSIHVIFLIFAT